MELPSLVVVMTERYVYGRSAVVVISGRCMDIPVSCTQQPSVPMEHSRRPEAIRARSSCGTWTCDAGGLQRTGAGDSPSFIPQSEIRDPQLGKPVIVFKYKKKRQFTTLAFSRDAKLLAAGGDYDDFLPIWEFATGERPEAEMLESAVRAAVEQGKTPARSPPKKVNSRQKPGR